MADVRYKNNTVYFTFKDVDLPFTAKGDVSLFVSDSLVEKYFKNNPQSETVNFTYEVQVNGKNTGVTKTWTLKKPSPTLPTAASYEKSSGGYTEESGDQAGRGTIYYEIQISTLLRHNNEMVIYDMPDANLELDKKSNLNVHFSPRPGQKTMLFTPLGHGGSRKNVNHTRGQMSVSFTVILTRVPILTNLPSCF